MRWAYFNSRASLTEAIMQHSCISERQVDATNSYAIRNNRTAFTNHPELVAFGDFATIRQSPRHGIERECKMREKQATCSWKTSACRTQYPRATVQPKLLRGSIIAGANSVGTQSSQMKCASALTASFMSTSDIRCAGQGRFAITPNGM